MNRRDLFAGGAAALLSSALGLPKLQRGQCRVWITSGSRYNTGPGGLKMARILRESMEAEGATVTEVTYTFDRVQVTGFLSGSTAWAERLERQIMDGGGRCFGGVERLAIESPPLRSHGHQPPQA